MFTKQTIAVIGATAKIGSAISKSLSKGNYRLLLKANRQEELDVLVKEIKSNHADADVEAAVCASEACWEADIIISAVPLESEKEVAEKIREVANQKIIIAIPNPFNKSGNGLVETLATRAKDLQKLLPNSKVIEAFSSTFEGDFDPTVNAGRPAEISIAGIDEDALQTVAELLTRAGFKPVVAGDISVSRTLEKMPLLHTHSDMN